MTPTHTATLLVNDRLTGETTARQVLVQVRDTRIEDERGFLYDKYISGAMMGPLRRAPVTHVRRLDLASLRPYVRPRVRL